MWDWDAEQAAKRPPTSPAVVWLGAGTVAAVVLVALVRITVLVLAHEDLPPARAGTPAAHRSAGPVDDRIPEATDILFGPGLSPENPDALNLGQAETLVLRGRDQELRLTPGAVGVRSGDCSTGHFLTVTMTVAATRGAATWDPAAFRLVDPAGHQAGVLTGCAGELGARSDLSAGRKLSGALAFAAESPTWLVYAPDGGTAQARWRLA